jgi:deoxyribose-phosphate aldolase
MSPFQELAKMIDHSLLQPTLTDRDLKAGCDIARQYDVASVCIKPYAVKEAVKWLAGSTVAVGTVIGFPHGNSSIRIKVAEAVRACKDGATEIDMVVNIGKVIGGQWGYVEREIRAITEGVHKNGGIVKVIFENDFLQNDKQKIRLCQICTAVGADFVKTSTGYGFSKGKDGKYGYEGATEHDLKLMLQNVGEDVQVKAAGGIRNLADMLKAKALGVTRIGASATVAMLEEAKKMYGIASETVVKSNHKDGY